MSEAGVGVMLGFGELEFILGGESRWGLMREQLNGDPPDTPQMPAAGAASLLARELAVVGSDGKIHVAEDLRSMVMGLTDCPCPVGISLIVGEMAAPAVYCPVPGGLRVLVSIENPGVAKFQRLPADRPVVDQAIQLVNKAVMVDGGVAAVKAVGQPGVLLRVHGGQWQLSDRSRGSSDPDDLFESSSFDEAWAVVRGYLERWLAPAVREV